MIKEITVGQEKFDYPIFLFEYLHSYLFRFALESGLYKGQEILDIPPNLLLKAKSSISDGLRDLLQICMKNQVIKRDQNMGLVIRR